MKVEVRVRPAPEVVRSCPDPYPDDTVEVHEAPFIAVGYERAGVDEAPVLVLALADKNGRGGWMAVKRYPANRTNIMVKP